VPNSIKSSVSRKLHLEPAHPIATTRSLIQSHFPGYALHHNLDAVVSVKQNFDSLGFPADHPGRSKTDTYYINKSTVLRTHTSAHQADIYRQNSSDGFLVAADVYRRDAIDRSHYPIFHQMEGAMLWDRQKGSIADAVNRDLKTLAKTPIPADDPNPAIHPERNPLQNQFHSEDEAIAISAHLKRSLELVISDIFTRGQAAAAIAQGEAPNTEPIRMRWIEAYFPFTSPSYELEVFYNNEWLELLGCGVIKQELLNNAGVSSKSGWAFGLGLERIAMLLFGVDDIRVFWSQDPRFKSQFKEGEVTRFIPFSKHPECWKDVAFWLPQTSSEASASSPGEVKGDSQEGHATLASEIVNPAGGKASDSHELDTTLKAQHVHENEVMEVVREVAGDLVEEVKLLDEFVNKKTGRKSLCYRINYRSLERTLTNEEVNDLQQKVRERLVSGLGVELR
jgi:phenylalanyl-tRNA synthetase alpha chain